MKLRLSLVAALASLAVACDPLGPPPRHRASHDAAAPTVVPAVAPSDEAWNASQIDWQPYDVGIARAHANGQPTCVVFYADWCPHCRSYSHVFDDPRVVAAARNMVMVRVNVDHEPEIAHRFQLDGGYVPRTYFVSPGGETLAEIDAHRPRFRYFYDEHDPSSILGAMDTALQRR